MFDGSHILRLIVLGSNQTSLMLVVPFVLKVDIFAISIRQSAAQTVEDRRPSADVPLLDHAGVDVDVLVAGGELPHLDSGSEGITAKTAEVN